MVWTDFLTPSVNILSIETIDLEEISRILLKTVYTVHNKFLSSVPRTLYVSDLKMNCCTWSWLLLSREMLILETYCRLALGWIYISPYFIVLACLAFKWDLKLTELNTWILVMEYERDKLSKYTNYAILQYTN